MNTGLSIWLTKKDSTNSLYKLSFRISVCVLIICLVSLTFNFFLDDYYLNHDTKYSYDGDFKITWSENIRTYLILYPIPFIISLIAGRISYLKLRAKQRVDRFIFSLLAALTFIEVIVGIAFIVLTALSFIQWVQVL